MPKGVGSDGTREHHLRPVTLVELSSARSVTVPCTCSGRKRLTSEQAMTHPWLTLRQPRPPAKARSRQASVVSAEPPLQAAQINLTQFVERWLEHPTSPYGFSEGSAELVLSRAGSAASVGLCSPSRCDSLTTPELSSEEESSGDEEPLFRPEPPKPVEHTRLSNIRREDSLKRARGRLVHQASKEEHYITIDQVKTLKQQGSLDEMVAKVSSSPSSRRGSVTQPPSAARLRTGDSPRPQTPSPLAAGTPQTERQRSPAAQTTVCDRVMSEATAALSDGPASQQRLSPTPTGTSPAPQVTSGTNGTGPARSPSPRGLSRAASPLLDVGGSAPTAKSKSKSPQPGPEASLSIPTRSRSQTPSVTVTNAEDPTADGGKPAAGGADPATVSAGATLKTDAAKKPRKSKSKDSASGDESKPHRRRTKTPSTSEASDGVSAELPASSTKASETTQSGKTISEPKTIQVQESQPIKSSSEAKAQTGKTTPEPKTIAIQQKSQPTKLSDEAKTQSGKTTTEPKTIKIQQESSKSEPKTIQIQQESSSAKSPSESKTSSGKSTPESRTIKIQQESPEKINSMIFNLKPVKRTVPSPIATTLTSKAPSSLGLVQLKKVSSSKSEAALTTKTESEAAQVKLRRTRPSDPLLSSSRDKPVLTRQKTDSGGSAVKKKTSTKHKPKHELDASRTNTAECKPSTSSKNGRRPREHIIKIEVLGCAGPEQGSPGGRPALRKLRQALRTLSSGSCQSAPSSPYPSRESSPDRELRPAGLLLRSWHRDRLREGGWSGRGPTLLDFVSARLEEAAGCQRREQEMFERLLKQRRPLSPPATGRRQMRSPLDWTRLGWSITD